MESLTGCTIFKNKYAKDDRGYFIEAYRQSCFSEFPDILQTNVSVSHKDVVRGFHFQKNPLAQGKLVRSLLGVFLDAVIDLRVGSPTYGQIESFLLQPEGISVYVPVGFGHSFWCLSDDGVFHYGCTQEYDRDSEGGISPIDPDLPLPWRDNPNIILSDKDKSLPRLRDFQSPFRMGS